MTDVGGIAADELYHHVIPWLTKKTIEMGRYGASELLRDKKTTKESCRLWNEKTDTIRL